MTAIFLITALAGGLGAMARLALDGAIRARLRSALPVGTIVINLTGSFALGMITGLAGAQLLPDGVRVVAGTGFLGGYTTFSTASFETVRLVQERRVGLALLNACGTLLGATLAAALGLVLGLAAGAGA